MALFHTEHRPLMCAGLIWPGVPGSQELSEDYLREVEQLEGYRFGT